MSDLQQISLCLRQVSNRSLILIDEFGKGTNESGSLRSALQQISIFGFGYILRRQSTNYYRWHWVSLRCIRALAQHERSPEGHRRYTLSRDFREQPASTTPRTAAWTHGSQSIRGA